MVAHQARRHGDRVDAALGEALADHLAGVELVGLLDLVLREPPHARDRSVEVVGVGGTVGGDVAARLRPRNRPGRVRVHNAADLVAPLLIEVGVGRGVRGRVEVALHDPAVEVADDEALRGELVVVNAGRLDNEQPPLPVELRGVAPGEDHQSVAREVHVGLVDPLAQLLEHHVHRSSLRACLLARRAMVQKRANVPVPFARA